MPLDDKGKDAEDKHDAVVSVNIEVSCPVGGSAASYLERPFGYAVSIVSSPSDLESCRE